VNAGLVGSGYSFHDVQLIGWCQDEQRFALRVFARPEGLDPVVNGRYGQVREPPQMPSVHETPNPHADGSSQASPNCRLRWQVWEESEQ
jgi:hypothetical protein